MTELIEILQSTTRTGSAEIALRAHGFDGDRLMRLARAVANDYCRKRGAVLGDRFDDLVSVLVLAGCKAATRYDPDRSGPNYSFASFLWDKMELAVEGDFFRRKAEGFGDRRYGNDNRIALVGDVIEELSADRSDEEWPEPAPSTDHPRPRWKDAAGLIDQDFADWNLVNERRVVNWVRAAEHRDLTLQEWIVRTLDVASRHALRDVA